MIFSLEVIKKLEAAGRPTSYLREQYFNHKIKSMKTREIDLFANENSYEDTNGEIRELSKIEILQIQTFGHTIGKRKLAKYRKYKPLLVARYERDHQTILLNQQSKM